MDFGGVGQYSYTDEKTFCEGFNGIRITSEMLLEKGMNFYEKEYSLWEKENQNIGKIEESLIQKLEEKRKRLKITLFNRENLKSEIADIEKELEQVRKKIEVGQAKKEKMDIFNNLTDEQKKAILQYLDSVKKCENIGQDISKKIDETTNIGRENSVEKRKKWQRAYDRMTKDGDITQEDIDEVNSVFMQEIAEKQDKYDDGAHDYEMNDISVGVASAISWYSKQVEITRDVEKSRKKIFYTRNRKNNKGYSNNDEKKCTASGRDRKRKRKYK